MTRILPEEVVAAYKSTGYKPSRIGYLIVKNERDEFEWLSPQAVIAIYRYGYKDEPGYLGTRIADDEYMGINNWYGIGHTAGFCGSEYNPEELTSSTIDRDEMIDLYKLGYEDGVAAWQLCLDERITFEQLTIDELDNIRHQYTIDDVPRLLATIDWLRLESKTWRTDYMASSAECQRLRNALMGLRRKTDAPNSNDI